MWKTPRKPRTVPKYGKSYSDWKDPICEDCFWSCVYCGLSLNPREATIEHFRPKSEFKVDEDNIENLYLACVVCNTFKGSDWPGEATAAPTLWPAYYRPEVDYNEVYAISGNQVGGQDIASHYMVEKLYLNRAQLILARRKAKFLAWAALVTQDVDRIDPLLTDAERVELFSIYRRLFSVCQQIHSAQQYEIGDTKRQQT